MPTEKLTNEFIEKNKSKSVTLKITDQTNTFDKELKDISLDN